MKNNKHHPLIKSIRFALSGIVKVIRNERNMKIHLFAALLVTFFGLIVGINKLEWLVLILLFFVMFAVETVNSSIETICNLLVEKLHLNYEETKEIRNISAGASMLIAIGAVIIGIVIFLPYFL